MNSEKPSAELADKFIEIVKSIMLEVRPNLIQAAFTGKHGESRNLRHSDNFLSVHDMWMHERYLELISEQIDAFVYASEEGEPQVIGEDSDPDLCILVDPLDTSELAVRGLNGYTHVMVYSRSLARPVLSVVGDIFHHIQIYVGFRDSDGHDKAFAITADGERHRLAQRKPRSLSESLVTNFLMRPSERFVPLSRQVQLFQVLDKPDVYGNSRGRIGLDFGSVSLCHVAAGFTEATIEFAKGFAIWDLAPGHYILHAAGGSILDLEGQPISLNYGLDTVNDISKAMKPRQKFVAAGSAELAHEILRSLQV